MIGTAPWPRPSSAPRSRAVRPSIMSLGLAPSAPASATRSVISAERRQRRVEIDLPIVTADRAVAVVGARAEADVHPEAQLAGQSGA